MTTVSETGSRSLISKIVLTELIVLKSFQHSKKNPRYLKVLPVRFGISVTSSLILKGHPRHVKIWLKLSLFDLKKAATFGSSMSIVISLAISRSVGSLEKIMNPEDQV